MVENEHKQENVHLVEKHSTDWKEQMPHGGFNRAAAVPSMPLRTLPGKVPANYFA